MIADPRFCDMASRRGHSEECVRILDSIFATRPRDEWLKLFREGPGEVICGPVNDLEDLVNDPQAQANDYVLDFNHPVFGPIKMPGVPVGFSKTPGGVRREAPEHGQHTEEVLMEVLGYSWEDIAKLRVEEVI